MSGLDVGVLEPVTLPSTEPITLALAKSHLRVPHELDDTYITQCIRAARDIGERITERRFLTQTWKVYLDEFPGPGREILVPYPPLQSVTSIGYVDENGDSQTWSASSYIVDTGQEPGRIRLAYGQVWPTPRLQPRAVTITFVCGYGADGDSLPPELLQTLLVELSRRYEFREPIITGTIATELPGFDRLWWPFRVLGADS